MINPDASRCIEDLVLSQTIPVTTKNLHSILSVADDGV
jgi:hypothetical protein